MSNPSHNYHKYTYPHVPTTITQVNVVDRRVVVSEKAAAGAVLAQRIEVGDVLEGYVTYVSDFGAFVVLNDPAGKVFGAEVCGFWCVFLVGRLRVWFSPSCDRACGP